MIAVVFVISSCLFAVCSAGKGICYPKYGCFDNDPPFNRPLVPYPAPADLIGTTYRLFTRSHPHTSVVIDDSDVSKLQASGYDGQKRTILIVHGFIEHAAAPWLNRIRHALLKKEDANVITVDWSRGASIPFEQAVANTRMVGAQVAELVKFLNNRTDNSPSSIYIIGFSLGAHVAGYVGRRIQKVGPKLGRITGLDPGSVFYTAEHIDVRLDPSDADFVDVYHTDMDFMGTVTQSGHLDFYPNGGLMQRGCRRLLDGPVDYVICDHMRAPAYYEESVLSQCPMRAYPCKNWQDFERGFCFDCVNKPCPSAGYNAAASDGGASGRHYLLTNEKKPFCVYHYHVTFKTGRGWFAGISSPLHITLYGTKGNSGVVRFQGRAINEGTKESFIAPVTKDLGTLTKIDVRHNGIPILERWYLEKVVVRPWDSERRYTGCYGSWITSAGGIRKLQQGELRC